jgi:hypothetical protein
MKSASTKNFPSFKTLYPDARLLLIATDADSPRVNRKLGIVESGLQNLQAAIQLALQ